MRYLRLVALLAVLCLLLCSCFLSRYTGEYQPSELIYALRDEISALADYSEYSSEDVGFMLDTQEAESFSVIYSLDGDDIGEVGVFRVRDGEDTDDMLETVNEYLEDVRQARTSFVRNYIPDELPKLDGAHAIALGRYVCYCILDSTTAKTVFDKLKIVLME